MTMYSWIVTRSTSSLCSTVSEMKDTLLERMTRGIRTADRLLKDPYPPLSGYRWAAGRTNVRWSGLRVGGEIVPGHPFHRGRIVRFPMKFDREAEQKVTYSSGLLN